MQNLEGAGGGGGGGGGGGVNKVHCGQHEKSELSTNVSCHDHFYRFWYRSKLYSG